MTIAPDSHQMRNARAIIRLLKASQEGGLALTLAAACETLTCPKCRQDFPAALGMRADGNCTIACPECHRLIYTAAR